MSLIELEDLSKTYRLGEVDLPVLRCITLSIAAGEMTALTGASGSGKSTLMNLLGCLDRPTSGRYRLQDREVSRLSGKERARVRRETIGFVFQSFNLLPRTSALENVLMPLNYADQRLGDRRMRERAAELLAKVGLGDRVDHHPSQLSGGQQQRVAIARALVNRPELLLADEPTGNLDSHTSREILAMFQQLNREEGITILLVTHDPGVAGHARRVIHLSDGTVASDTINPAAS